MVMVPDQQARHTMAYTPPGVVYGIVEARTEIQRIKTALRSRGILVEDEPNDI